MERREHIVSAYEEDLSSLNNKIAKMGGLAEQVVGQSLEALEKRDRTLAERTIKLDETIDRLEVEIEHDVGVMIVKRQPVAYDLRQVMAPFRIATDLERIGDHTTNIAEIVYFVVHGTAINDQRPKADTTNISLVAAKGM